MSTSTGLTQGGGGRINGLVPSDGSDHPDNMKIRLFGDEAFSSVVGFGSRHDDTVNFSFCDGSVHAIETDIDRKTLRELAAASDGGVPLDF